MNLPTLPAMGRGALIAPMTLATLSLGAAAQSHLAVPHSESRPYRLASGPFVNRGIQPQVVDAQVVHVPGADSLRLIFDEVELGPGDRLDVHSLADGEVHSIDREQLASWGSTSAYLNGDTLILELIVAPESRSSYALDAVLVGSGVLAPQTICGFDDRVPSSDPRVARLLDNSGNWTCTGFLAPGGCAMTAGHCIAFADTAQFNVPSSLPNGALQHPPIEDQFPANPSSFAGEYVGEGQDWSIYRLQTNVLGEDAHQKYGSFAVASKDPSTNDAVRVTGNGADTGPDNTIQQTHVGPFVGISGVGGTVLEFIVDVNSGSSGSPLIEELSGEVVGIVTGGGCGTPAIFNLATSLQLWNLQQVFIESCGGPSLSAAFESVPAVVAPGGTAHFRDMSSGSPVAWYWDLDGDGSTDSTAAEPAFTYGTAGSYSVSLTVDDGQASDSVTQAGKVLVVPTVPVHAPFGESFSVGLPQSGAWSFATSGAQGFIDTVSDQGPSPGSGGGSLALAASVDGYDIVNEAILHVDLSSGSNVQLKYWYRETGDEDHPEDGLFLSDGTSEVLAQSHMGGPSVWTEFTVDVGALISSSGLVPTADFRLIFRQRDNYPLGSDGVMIDDVSIEPILQAPWLVGSPPSVSVAAGGTHSLELNAGPAHSGLLYIVAGSASGTSPGQVIAGAPIPLVSDWYFLHTLTKPNQAPLFGSRGYLDLSGRATISLVVPAGTDPALAGATLNHAAVVIDLDAVGSGSGSIDLVLGPEPVQLEF